MTVQELYDYITNEMTPEEALKKLLEGSLLNYEKLKFDKGEEVHPIIIVANAAMDMGWEIAIENNQDEVRGIIIGTEKYMNNYRDNCKAK